MTKLIFDVQIRNFLAVRSPRELALVLKIEYKKLTYLLYRLPDTSKYNRFFLPKKNGTPREILAPYPPLKKLQKNLNDILQKIYVPKNSVHGFVLNRNVISNSMLHCRKRFVFNLDINNFFPSINFGRVRGMFMVYPFNFPASVATVLAQICCVYNVLPQGAPTSPIVSNLIAARMDLDIGRLCKIHKCDYSRYADDITISTSLSQFPRELGFKLKNKSEFRVGGELTRVIEQNGFRINPLKTRLAMKYQKQTVTGLTVNEFPNVNRFFIKKISAMIHAWSKFGYDAAEKVHFQKYAVKHRNALAANVTLRNIIRGKLEYLLMIRKKARSISSSHRRLKEQFDLLTFKPKYATINAPSEAKVVLMCEGRTDWKHIKIAYEKLKSAFPKLDLYVEQYPNDMNMNDQELLKRCRYLSLHQRNKIYIALFDRDNSSVVEMVENAGQPRDWGNNVYSFALPMPSHRVSDICIELFYKDSEITTLDASSRRLYLNTEFNVKFRLKNDPRIVCGPSYSKKFNTRKLFVIDSDVHNENSENIALPKNQFATYIFNQLSPYNNFDYTEFSKVFEIIQIINDRASTTI